MLILTSIECSCMTEFDQVSGWGAKDGSRNGELHRRSHRRDVAVLHCAVELRQVCGRGRNGGVDELRVRPSHCTELRRLGGVAEAFCGRQLRSVTMDMGRSHHHNSNPLRLRNR